MRRYRRTRKPAGIQQQILSEIRKLQRQVSRMDARIEKLRQDFDAETTRIADLIDEIRAKPDQTVEEVIAAFEPISARLRAVGADPAQPIPPVE